MEQEMSHKDTEGKLKLNLIPPHALVSIAKVREFGNNKYKDPWGWRDHVTVEQLMEAAKRHMLRIDLGEDLDSESGLHHLDHALCSLAMAVEVLNAKKENKTL